MELLLLLFLLLEGEAGAELEILNFAGVAIARAEPLRAGFEMEESISTPARADNKAMISPRYQRSMKRPNARFPALNRLACGWRRVKV